METSHLICVVNHLNVFSHKGFRHERVKKYLLGLFFPRIAKEYSFISKYTLSFFCSVWKETTHKLNTKVTTAKNFFWSVYVIVTAFFDNFFIPCDYWKTLFLIKVCRKPKVLFNCQAVFFFETIMLRVRVFFFYLHNTRKMLIPKFQSEAVVCHSC